MAGLDEKQKRMKSVLATAAVLVCALLAGLAVCAALIAHESQLSIGQQDNGSGPMAQASSSREKRDPTSISTKQTEVPDIGSLIGLTYEQAISSVGHGATVVDDQEANDREDSAKRRVTVALTAERSDPQTGAPTVYLGLDEGGRVCSAGYSVSMESLGYSNELTFRQAVQRVHVVERTLADAGVQVELGAAKAPADRKDYSTYLSDGRTLQREYVTFSGDTEVDGIPMTWSAALDYNYSDAIDTGNLADTIHLITVGVATK